MESIIVKQLHTVGVQNLALRVACQKLPLEGRMSHFIHNREVITKDTWVLNTLQGYEVDQIAQPYQTTPWS